MIRLFLHSIRYRWFEYLAGATVVAVVVAALIVQRSLSASAESQIHDLSHNLGKNMLVVPAGTDLFDFYTLRYGSATMPDNYPEKIRSSELGRHIRAITPQLFGSLEVDGVHLTVVGQSKPRQASRSRGSSAPSAVLGDEAALRLGLARGDTLMAGDVPLVVTRVTSSVPDGFDMAVFTELSVAQEILGQPGAINAMRMGGCWCRTDVPALAAQVQNLLPGTRAITVAGVIKSQTGIIAKVKRYSNVLYGLAILLIAGITAALTSGQLRRHIREIGLLLAIGTRISSVTVFFVIMAALIGTVGAGIGFLLGFPLTEYLALRLIGYSLPVSGNLVAPILGLSIGVSVLSALVPALRAARLDPTIVLREL